jgi:hypothetical protein
MPDCHHRFHVWFFWESSRFLAAGIGIRLFRAEWVASFRNTNQEVLSRFAQAAEPGGRGNAVSARSLFLESAAASSPEPPAAEPTSPAEPASAEA